MNYETVIIFFFFVKKKETLSVQLCYNVNAFTYCQLKKKKITMMISDLYNLEHKRGVKEIVETWCQSREE